MEWTMFDTAKLEASQRALTHAADVLRWNAAASAAEAAPAKGSLAEPALGSSWLAVSPEGMCLALRACVENGGGRCGVGVAGMGERLGVGFVGVGSHHHQAEATAASSG